MRKITKITDAGASWQRCSNCRHKLFKLVDGYKISNLKPAGIVIEIKCSSCKEINIIKY